MIRFSLPGIHQSRKARWIHCLTEALVSPFVTRAWPTALYQSTDMPTAAAASASGSGLGWAARNRGITANGKRLSGIEGPLSLAFPDIHTRKPAALGEAIFAPVHVMPAGWLGWLELPGKDRSVWKSPAVARDCPSPGERPAARLKPWYVTCATELRMQLPALAVVLAAAF